MLKHEPWREVAVLRPLCAAVPNPFGVLMQRIEPYNAEARLFALASWILSIPRNTNVDAIAVFPGLGETVRIRYAIERWQHDKNLKNLLIAGQNSEERTFYPLTSDRLRTLFQLTRTCGVLIQENAKNTKEQADWVAKEIFRNSLRSCALCAPPYHIVRAFLTVLKSLEEPIIIIPAPIPMSPRSVVPELNVEADLLIPGELQRIKKYQELGDVATFDELREYLGWLHHQ